MGFPIRDRTDSCLSYHRSERRLAKFQRLGLFVEDHSDTVYTRAVSARQCMDAYTLAHDIFVSASYMDATPTGMRIRCWETDPETATFVAIADSEVVGVFSCILDSHDLGLPADRPFAKQLETIRGGGGIVCELSNLCVAEDFRATPVVTELMRMAFAHAYHIGCTDLICEVSANPSLIGALAYIGFEKVSDAKSSSREVDDPVVLLWLPRIQRRWTDDPPTGEFTDALWREYFVKNNRHHRHIQQWRELSRKMFEDPVELVALFGGERELFTRSNERELEAITRRLGRIFEPRCRSAYGRPASGCPPSERAEAPLPVGLDPQRSPSSSSPPPADSVTTGQSE